MLADGRGPADHGHDLVLESGARRFALTLDASDEHRLRTPECWGTLHPHHILPRSRGGADVLDNLVTLCAAHHQFVHEHPTLSKSLCPTPLR